jgi:uroporphyrinogen-III synthase
VSSASPRVLVTRALEDAPQLASALAQGGFEPVVVPVLERRWLPLAVAELAEREPEADWVVITSAAAAEVVAIGAPTGCPKADLAGPALGQALQRAGATVHEVVAYENVAPTGYAERLLAALPVRATTLMSGSAAERVAEAVPEARRHELGAVVVIGPSTATVAQARGLTIAAQAAPHTVTGLVAAVALALGSPRREPD